MRKKFNRMLAVLLVFTVSLTFLPISAFASGGADGGVVGEPGIEQPVEQPSGEPAGEATGGTTDATVADTQAGGGGEAGSGGEQKVVYHRLSYKVDGVEVAWQDVAENALLPAPPAAYLGFAWTSSAGDPTIGYVYGQEGWPAMGTADLVLSYETPEEPEDEVPAGPQESGSSASGFGEPGAASVFGIEFLVDGAAYASWSSADGAFVKPADPAAPEGWVFDGWYEDGAAEAYAFDFGAGYPAAGVVLEAKFVEAEASTLDAPTAYFVHFYVSEDDTAPYGSLPIDESGRMLGLPFILLSGNFPAGKTNFLYWGASPAAETAFDFGQVFAGSVNVYAVFEARYLVQFEDVNGNIVDSYYVNPGEPVYNTNAEAGLAAGQQFKYWYATDGDGNPAQVDGNGKPVPYGFGGTTNKDLYLRPYSSNEYYVIFVSQGTQVKYQLVDADVDPYATRPADPTRAGYTFAGWTTDQLGTTPYDFGAVVTGDVTLYAQWTANQASYTIVYWREKANIAGDPGADKNNYEYFGKETRQALSGSALALNASVVANPQVNVLYAGFSFADANYKDENGAAVVMGNGTTVVNAYYKRTVYTFVFDLNPGTNSTTTRAGATMVFDGKTYTQGVDPDGNALPDSRYSFTAKYEQDIENLWPSSWNATFERTARVYNKGSWGTTGTSRLVYWDAGSAFLVTKRFTVTVDDLMPTSGTTKTFTAAWGNTTKYAVEYWLEALPHQTEGRVEKTVGGVTKYFVKSDKHSQDELWLEGSLAAKSIEGMTYIPSLDSMRNATTYQFYYTRKAYTITFNNVAGGPAAPDKASVLFETQLTAADHFPAAYSNTANPPKRTVDGVEYTFAGWYYDAEYMKPVVFGVDSATSTYKPTMPNQNLGVFAKWTSNAFHITFYDDFGGSTAVGGGQLGAGYASYLTPDAAEAFTGFVPGVTVVAGKGTFEGWYVPRPGGGFTAYSYETPIYEDLQLYANYTTTGFTVDYDNGAGSGSVPSDYTQNNGGKGYNLNQQTRVMNFIGNQPSEDEVFIGWAVYHNGVRNEDEGLYNPGDAYVVSGNTTFVAQFGNLADYIEVVYHSNYPAGLGMPEEARTQYARRDNEAHKLYGAIYTLPAAAMEGWSFSADAASAEHALSGTMSIPAVVARADSAGKLHLYAVWNTNTPPRTVIFTADSGGRVSYNGLTQATHTIDNILYGTLWSAAVGVANPEPVPNAGYRFVGWKLDGAFTSLPAADTAIIRNYTFVAVFEPLPVYTVTFNWLNADDSAATGAKGNIREGTLWSAAGISIPTPTDTATQIFTGWAVSVDPAVAGYAPANDPNDNADDDLAILSNLTFTAQYRERAAWTVTFQVAAASAGRGTLNGGTTTPITFTVLEGLALSTATGWASPEATPAVAPAGVAYSFENWTGPNGTYDSAVFPADYVPLTDGEVIEANFLVTQKYKLTYVDNRPEGTFSSFPDPAVEYYFAGESVTVKSAAGQQSSSGHHYFLGWTSDGTHQGEVQNANQWEDLVSSGTFYAPGTTFEMPAEDVDLYPVFGNKPYNGSFVEFTVVGPGGFEGYTADQLPVIYGNLTEGARFDAAGVTIPTPAPDADAWFVGWFVDGVEKVPTAGSTVPAGGITYEARFAQKSGITLTAGSATKEYDGTPLTNGDVTADPALPAGYTVTATMTPESTITNVGTQPNVIDEATVVIRDAGGHNVTYQYSITDYIDGELEITPKAIVPEGGSLVYKWDGYERTYDGTEYTHTDEEGVLYLRVPGQADAVFDLADYGLTITHLPASATGTNVLRDAGLAVIGYPMSWTGDIALSQGGADVTSFYGPITYEAGELKINPVTLTLTATPTSVTYDDAAVLTFTMTGTIPAADQTGGGYVADLNALFGMTDDGWLTSGYDPATWTGDPESFDILFTAAAHTNTAVTATQTNYVVTLADALLDAEGNGGLIVTDVYKVIYHNGLAGATGALPATRPYTEGATVTVNTTENLLTHTDYTFVGWRWTDGDGTVHEFAADGTVQTLVMPAANVDLYAVWKFAGDAFTLDASGFDRVYDGTEASTQLSGPLAAGDIVTYTLSDGSTHSYVYGIDTAYEFTSIDVVDESVSVTIERVGVEPVVIENVPAVIRPRAITVSWTSTGVTYDGTSRTAGNVAYTVGGSGIAGTDAIADSANPTAAGTYADTYAMAFAAGSEVGMDNGATANNRHLRITRGGVEATYNYVITEDPGTFTIAPLTITVRSASDSKLVYDGIALTNPGYTVDATVNGVSGTDQNIDALAALAGTGHVLNVTITGSQTEVGSSDNTFDKTKTTLLHGTVDVLANGSVVVNYAEGTLTVAGKLAVTFTTNGHASYVYDGTLKTVTGYTNSALAAGHTHEGLSASGSGTEVGTYTNAFADKDALVIRDAGGNPVTDNYAVTWIETPFQIVKRTVEVFVDPETLPYNGVEQTSTRDVQATNLAANMTVGSTASTAATAAATGTNVYDPAADRQYAYGEYHFYLNGVLIDAARNLTVTERAVSMSISPAEVSIATLGDTKAYDGTPLTRDGFSFTYGATTIDGGLSGVALDITVNDGAEWFKDHALTLTVDGSQTAVGTSPNSTSGLVIMKGGEDRTGNFTITPNYGTLEVTPLTLTVTVYGNEGFYTGYPMGIEPDDAGNLFSVTGFLAGEGLSDATVAAVNAWLDATYQLTTISTAGQNETLATSLSGNTGLLVVSDGAGNAITDGLANYTIVWNDGELVLKPRPITYISASAGKVYDGTPLYAERVAVYDGAFTSEAGLTAANLIANNGEMAPHTYGGVALDVTVANGNGPVNRGTLANTFDAREIAILDQGGLAANNNFIVHTAFGALSITGRPVLLTAHSAGPITADGTFYEVDGFDTEASTGANPGRGLLGGHSLSGMRAHGGSSIVGTYAVTFSGSPVVTDTLARSSGNLAPNYDFYTRDGQLVLVGGGGGGPTDPPIIPGGGGDDEEEDDPPEIIPDDGGDGDTLIDNGTPEGDGDLLDPNRTPEVELFTASWALLNLMVAVLAAVFAVLLIVGLFKRNKKAEEEDEEQKAQAEAKVADAEGEDDKEEDKRNPKSGIGWRIFSILAGIAAPIAFFLTENITLPMVFTDRWTLLMLIILVVQVIGMLLLRRARNQENEQDDDTDTQDTPAQA